MTIFDYRIISLQTRTKPPFLPKTPHFGPQMLFKHVSDDFGKFQIFEIFDFGEPPDPKNIFFANFFRAESFVGPIS